MSFDYEIKADASQANTEIDGMVDNLTDVERHAKTVGDAIDKAFTSPSTRGAKGTFSAIAVSVEDVAAAFERINAPLDKAEKDMKILDELWGSGAITAKQYADELDRIAKSAGFATAKERAQTGINNVSLPSAPEQAGSAASAIGGAATVAAGNLVSQALSLVGKGLVETINFYAELREEETQTANATLKFYDSMEQAAAGVEDLKGLADDLHVRLGKAAEAYGAVREASQGAYLSQREMIDVTRNLSATMITDNKSIGDVSVVMAKLQYAMEAGKLELRDVRSIAREYPDTMQLMEKSLGVNLSTMLKMAQGGQLTKEKIVEMLHGMADSDAMEKFGMRALTIADILEQKLAPNTFEATIYLANHRDEWTKAAPTITDAMDKIGRHGDQLRDSIKETTDALTYSAAVAALAFSAPAVDRAGRDTTMRKDLTNTLRDAKQDLADLQAMADQGSVAKNQQLQNKVNSLRSIIDPKGFATEQRLLNEFVEPYGEFRRTAADLQQLLASGVITHDQFTDAWLRQYATLPKVKEIRQEMEAHTRALAEEAKEQELARKSGIDSPASVGLTGPQYAFENSAAHAAQNAMLASMKALDDETAKHDAAIAALAQKYDTNVTPLERYKQALIEINDQSDKFTEDALARMRSNAQTQYWNEVGQAAQKAAAAIKETNEVEVAAEGALKQGASTLADTLMQAANGADVSWTKWGKNLLDTIAKAIIQAEILRAIGSSGIGGGMPSGVLGFLFGGGHATGGSYTAPETGGGPDSIPVLFRMNPGETANFTNRGQLPSQSAGGGGGGAPAVQFTFHGGGNSNHEDVVQAMDSRNGDALIYNFMSKRRNRRAVQSLTRRR